MTDRIAHSCVCEAPETADVPVKRVAAMAEPSTGLLDRAQAGWERFLSTFEAVCHD
ncbi:hypothetical protein ACFWP3_29255 [Streptomyces sp. NPDC058525]|uniref:hypothetical protein n=1 Tax=unclassified Streptomyces TaxID=2593676 RepID=UPI003653FE05